MDFESYPRWNPFVRSIDGEPAVGSTLDVEIRPEGGFGMKLKPKVVAFEPERRFAWMGNLGFKGIFDGRHEFAIEDRAAQGIRFLHREEFSGILVPLLWPLLRSGTKRGFEQMNKALKLRSEGNSR